MALILIAEDNKHLRGLMAVTLQQANFHVLEAGNGEEALDMLDIRPISLIIADLLMPVMDGYALIESLRDVNNSIPILVVSAKETIADKRKVFQLGADDYMVKPIDVEEMIMRVEALLRRAQIAQSHTLKVGETTLNEDSLTSVRDGRIRVLPCKEFFLLQTLLSYPGKIFTRQSLMDAVWGYENESDPRTVDVHIRRLREKYDRSEDFAIETVRGLGYRAVVR